MSVLLLLLLLLLGITQLFFSSLGKNICNLSNCINKVKELDYVMELNSEIFFFKFSP
jgi:hypothetical protein